MDRTLRPSTEPLDAVLEGKGQFFVCVGEGSLFHEFVTMLKQMNEGWSLVFSLWNVGKSIPIT